jgi:hypothetical protein
MIINYDYLRLNPLGKVIKAIKVGYVKDFNLQEECLECRNGNFKVFAKEFEVDKFFRFEGESDPGDASILYAISSESKGLKGVLVSPYSIYSEAVTKRDDGKAKDPP